MSKPEAAAPPKGRAEATPQTEELLGKAYDARLMRRLWDFIRPYKSRVWLSAFVLLVATLAQLIQPYILRLGIDLYILQPEDGAAKTGLLRVVWRWGTELGLNRATGLAALSGVLLFAVVAEQLLRFAQLYLMQMVGQRAMNDLRSTLHRHVQRLAMSFFDRTPVGRVMTRLTTDVESLSELFATGVVAVLGDLVFLLGLMGVLIALDVRLAAVTFTALPILLVAVALFRRYARIAFREIRVRIAKINAFLQEHITGMKVVQLFAQESRIARYFEVLNREHMDANTDAIRYDSILFAFVEMISSVVIAALVWFGARRVLSPESLPLTFGVLVAFIDYSKKFFIPIRDLSERFTVLQQGMASAERIFGLLDTAEFDAPGAGAAHGPAVSDGDRARPLIELVDVGFSYRGRADEAKPLLAADEVVQSANALLPADSDAEAGGGGAIRGVSLSVRAGEQVAIVGSTGAGKTTLAKLLVRLYEPQSGSLRLGGIDVRELPLAELRRKVVLVPQDVFLFSGDLYSNIALGDDRITLEAVEAAGKSIGLDRLVARLASGYHERIQERGANLSAGERQLIAFARALVRDPEVLLLDEATANVDPEAERRIQQATELLLRGRTALIIAHRLSTLERVGRIVVMHRGRIAEQGTHAELLAAGGIYARLYRLQQAA